MVRTLLSVAVVTTFAGAVWAHGTQYPWDWYTTGVYDEQTSKLNAVDVEAAGNAKTLAQFKIDVTAAFEGNYGGVCGWDYSRNLNRTIASDPTSTFYGLSDGTNGRADNRMRPLWKTFTATNSYYGDGYIANGYNNQPIEIFYGKDSSHVGPADWAAPDHDAGKRIQIDVWDNMDIWTQDGVVATPISGCAWLRQSSSTTVPTPPLLSAHGGILGPGPTDRSDQVPGQTRKAGLFFHREFDPAYPDVTATWTSSVKEIAFTGLGRGTVQNWDAWAVFSDGTELHTYATISSTAADTFFYFAAPAGKYINEIWWSSDQDRPMVDDLGFILENAPPPANWHTGDANHDLMVDLQDFGLLKLNYGHTADATWEMGDFNHDGNVDLQDFGLLKVHYGHSGDAGVVPVTAVPEPVTLAVLMAGAAGLARRRR